MNINKMFFKILNNMVKKKESGVGKVLIAYILHEHKHLLFLANNSE